MLISNIYQEFFENADRAPHGEALVSQKEHITFNELFDRVGAIASQLPANNSPDAIVGICLINSTDVVAAILGVLKQNYAFLLLDPLSPLLRLEYMVKDASLDFIVTSANNLGLVPKVKCLINLDDLAQKKSHVGTISVRNDLAYLVYTSGTTGTPKGVMIDHLAIWNRLRWMRDVFEVNGEDVVLQKASFSFDVSIWELVLGAVSGASTVLLQKGDEKDPSCILAAIKKYQITIVHFVPSLFLTFLEYVKKHNVKELLLEVRCIFVSGEKMSTYLIEYYYEIFDGGNCPRLINLYGPAEAAIDVSFFECKKKNVTSDVPIGKEIDGVAIYILDKKKDVCKLGELGEICISGICLSRGYLNDDELNKTKFISPSFDPQLRLYCTGDFGHRSSNGNIYFAGREDQQFKIRGSRVELGEIESALHKIDQVENAIISVITDERGKQKMCAFYMSEKTLNNRDLQNQLKISVPEFMIPNYIMRIELIPLTQNGKVDHRELKRLYFQKIGHLDDSAKHSDDNSFELELLAIWSSVLGTEINSTHVDYSDLGGDSVDAVRIASMVESLGYNCRMQDVYYHGTIQKLSEYLLVSQNTHKSKQTDLDELNIIEISEKNVNDKSDKERMEQYAPNILKSIRTQEIKYNNHLIKSGINADYTIAAFENNFRQYYREVYFVKNITFNGHLDYEKLSEAIDHAVQGQGLLRSAIVTADNKSFWREFNGADRLVIPTIDLSGYRPNTVDNFINDVVVKYYAANDRLRPFSFRLLLIKFSSEDHKLLCFIDESIHDQYTEGLIARIIEGYYYRSESISSSEFKNYIKSMEDGPKNIDGKSIIKDYKLNDILNRSIALRQCIDKRSSYSGGHFYFTYSLGGMKLDKWAIAVTLLSSFCRKEFDMDEIPVWTVNNCRSYDENKYMNTVGGFADYVPCLINTQFSKKNADDIRQNIRRSVSHNINFQNLFHNPNTKAEYKDLQILLKDIVGNLNKTKSVFIFDFNINADDADTPEILSENSACMEIIPRWLHGFCFWVKFIKGNICISIHFPYQFNKKQYEEYFRKKIREIILEK